MHGTFFRHEALDSGYTDADLRAAVRAGVLHRVRQGAYASARVWVKADATSRHRILARTLLRQMPGPVALTHTSSMIERGVQTWGIDLRKVHLTRLDKGAGRVDKDAVHHEGELSETDLEQVNGLLVVKAPRGLVEAVTITGVQSGLVMADSALHLGIVEADEFTATYEAMRQWPRARVVQLVHRLADGRAESPGETRTRYLCWTRGLPMPELQFRVYDEHGQLIAIVDFYWRQLGVLGEFDGRIKYGRLLKPGQEPGDVMFEEKRREDLVREVTRLPMVRFTWDQFQDPKLMASRVWKLARRSA